MKAVSIGTDQKIFDENSPVRQRVIEYGKFFDELHIITFTPNDGKYKFQKISDNIFLYPTKSKIRAFFVFDFIKIIRKILRTNGKRDFILTCQDPFETGITGAFAKLYFNLPLHIQIHTDLMHKYFREASSLNKVRYFIAEFVLKYADRVRVVSERIKKSIERFSKNIDVLPIKADINMELEEEIKKPFPFTLLMVCRIEKEKNIETVLQSIKGLDNNIGLCLVGDGSQKTNLEEMSKNLGISNRVVFAGWKNNLAPYYKIADAFISASLYEGYGISTVEAAYFGKPLVLSETGVAGEIFKENESAFVCDAKDKVCFAESIPKLYEDKNLAQRMGQSAKIAVDKHLKLDKNYFEEYAYSIIKTASNFKKRNIISRIFDFKMTVFRSFRVLRYFICGITSASANIGFLYIFADIIGIWYLYSSILAFLLALIISFILQKFVVFKDVQTNKIHHQFSRFFIAAIFGVVTNTIIVFVCVDMFGIWYIFSQIIAGFFVMIQNFILYKFFIFNK